MKSSRTDEIIVGSRGHGPYRRPVLGSTVKRVAANALPITVVPARAAERVGHDYS